MDGSCENSNEASGSVNVMKSLNSCTACGFSREVQLREISYGSAMNHISGIKLIIYDVISSSQEDCLYTYIEHFT